MTRAARSLAIGALCAACCAGGLQAQGVSAPAGHSVKVAAHSEEGVRWQTLSPAQRTALAPLETEWPNLEAARKQKWLVLADRFKSMTPDERTRITARMSEWAKLTPTERGLARLRYQEAKDLPLADRRARWEEYQALAPDARQKFVARAASAASAPVTHRDGAARVAATSSGAAGHDAKTNVVPNPALGQAPRPVAPTLVQVAPGATTTSITRRPMPPAHQQTGMPKIAGTPEFVNRATLLPRRGPQAAGIASAPSIRPNVLPPKGVAPKPLAPAAAPVRAQPVSAPAL